MKSMFTCFLFLLFVVVKPIGAFAQYTPTNVQDSLALVALYDSTDGAHWKNHTGWLQGPVPTWYGVQAKGRVTSIDLHSNNLTGIIPHQLGNLTSLTILLLPINNLTGTLPAELGNLKSMVEFYASFNQLSGSIPAELANASALTYIEFDQNYFTDVPGTFGNHYIGSLTLEYNDLTFTGLESLAPSYPDAISYAPQRGIRHINSNGLLFSVSAGGTLQNNTYHWFTTDKLVDTLITGDSTFKPTKNGNYCVNITNSIAKKLTLTSDTIAYTGGTNGTTGLNQGDSVALVSLYNRVGGSNWINHTNWLTAQPVSTWYGVTVANHRIIRLVLPANNLNGLLTETTLGDLDSLVYADLHNNSLSGPIGSSFIYLYKLAYLDLSNNYLSNVVPSEIGNDTSLTTVLLQHNQFTDLPGSFNQLIKLTKFDGSYNALTGDVGILNAFGSCPNLDTLKVNYNLFTGNLPTGLKKLTHLSYLDLSANQLSGKITNVFAAGAPLSYLALSNNPFASQTIPVFLTKLTKLKTLSLGNDNLTGTIPASIKKITSLVSLSLPLNHLQGSIPPAFNNMAALSLLDVSQNSLSGELPNLFHNFTMKDFTLTANGNNLTSTNNQQWNGTVQSGSTSIKLYNNRFTFSLLEFLNEKFDSVADYPQALLTIYTHGNKLGVSAGGTLSRNTYIWYKTGTSTPVVIITGDSTYQPATSGSYYVAVTNSVVKFLTLTANAVSYTAANSADAALTVSVYPNPVRGMITLNNLSDKSDNKITIADMSGYVWLTAMSHQQTSLKMDASRLRSGNYLVTVTDGKNIRTVQFVKE